MFIEIEIIYGLRGMNKKGFASMKRIRKILLITD